MFTICLLTALAPCIAVMVVGIRNAPEGEQIDGQFHFVWRNDSPDRSDIACIWTPFSEQCVVADSHHAAAVA